MAITKGTYTAFASPASSSATTIVSSSFTSTGSGLLIAVALFEGANTTCTFTDSKGNTWQTAAVTTLVNQFSIHAAMCWSVPTTVGTSHTVTCTFGAGRTFRRICVLNVNGTFSASDALDVTAQLNDGNGGTPDAGSLVTSAATICVQGLGDNAGQTPAAGSGWTKDSSTAGSHFQSRLEATSGTFNPVFGTDGYDWATVAMAFKETAGDSVDDLLANDVSSTSNVTVATLGQVHALLANDVQSTSNVTVPALGQKHVLLANDVESDSEVSTPAAAHIHVLLANDVQSTSNVTTPAIAQIHVLLANDVQSTSEVSSPAVGEEGTNALLANDVESTSQVSVPALGQVHVLLANDVESDSQVSSPALDAPAAPAAITRRNRAPLKYVPTKSPINADPVLRVYVEREFQAVARAMNGIGDKGLALRRVYSIAEFPGDDFGERTQAAYDHALAEAQAGDGLGEGIVLIIPPNPDGGWWMQSTEVDFSSGGYVQVIGLGSPYIVAAAALNYHFQFGVTNKSDRTTIDNLEFRHGDFTIPTAINIGGGTRCRLSNLGFQKTPGDLGSYTNGIDIDAANDPTTSGISYLVAENIHDTGGGAVTNAMIRANGLISSHIRHMRVSKASTYGVELISDSQAVQGNTIEGLHGEAGLATNHALVRLNGTTNDVAYNTVRSINGQNFVDYGAMLAGSLAKFIANDLDIAADSFVSGAIEDLRV